MPKLSLKRAAKKPARKKNHRLNKDLMAFCRALYSAGAATYSTKPSMPILEIPAYLNERFEDEGIKMMRTLTAAINRQIALYDEAILAYSRHKDGCAWWADGDCSCGLQEVLDTIKAGAYL